MHVICNYHRQSKERCFVLTAEKEPHERNLHIYESKDSEVCFNLYVLYEFMQIKS